MHHRDIKSTENKNYLSYILELKKLSYNISDKYSIVLQVSLLFSYHYITIVLLFVAEMSAHIYNTVAALKCNNDGNANFIRAKQIIHETLFYHYIILVKHLPAIIQNTSDISNTTIRYRCLP